MQLETGPDFTYYALLIYIYKAILRNMKDVCLTLEFLIWYLDVNLF